MKPLNKLGMLLKVWVLSRYKFIISLITNLRSKILLNLANIEINLAYVSSNCLKCNKLRFLVTTRLISQLSNCKCIELNFLFDLD